MYQFKNQEDTIVAIATPPGQGGIGIVRLSGTRALAITDRMFVKKNGAKPSVLKSHTVHYGDVMDREKGEAVDEALLTVMRAPKSYTREDVVEISCHGGAVSLKAILALAMRLGARLAEPGEFTKRAFLNGRIDLTQAEAVLDIIQAKTDAFLKVSTHQLKGDLSAELEAIREQIMNIYVAVEAIVNFPEDGIEGQGKEKIMAGLTAAKDRVGVLVRTGEQGRVLKEGIKIVLCGRPNVGKSSLLNALLRTPRAIVSDIPGTTRDTIEETAQIRGIPFQLVDTAGILEPRDRIEQEAVARSRMHIAGADLVLFIFDASEKLGTEDERLMQAVNGQNVIAVLNKCDLPRRMDDGPVGGKYGASNVLTVSAKERIGLDRLEAMIVENIWHGTEINTHGILISNVRHRQALEDCQNNLEKGMAGLENGLSLEFVSEEIKAAVNCLDNITGRNIDEDLLDTIFSRFCIGK